MTRQQFIDEWKAELSGLLMESFRAAGALERGQRMDLSDAGRAMLAQLHAAYDLLGRQYDSLFTPAVEANGHADSRRVTTPPVSRPR
jgi:hypothetical protein